MKVLVAGSRSITDPALVRQAILDSKFPVTTLICGMAKGVDRLAESWALTHSPPIPVQRYYPNWNEHGRAAGMIRNKKMVEAAEAAVIVWDGASRGTRNTIELIQAKGIPMSYLCLVETPPK